MRKGNFDAINETIYQFGHMGDNEWTQTSAVHGNQKNLHINAWATRNWIGYTHYQSAWKPRLAVNFDYASGDGRANCTFAGPRHPVKLPTRLRTCTRPITFTWAIWMSKPGRT